MVDGIINGAVSLRFGSMAAQTLSVAYGSPSLRCFFEAALPRRSVAEMDPATRYTLRCNIASIMKI